ncbi:trans-sulfuration enzyme family protein [Gudongella oleilytica]|jgi:methionine-gamma-lyase|uniref:trans-sulfuration enzyme family protein n=1 Tax=Gudongella oleilytica TaxID=1582259 RepID=UPI000FF896FC|nr:PLP-dependent aspartate aminotransferase family protein [Gudongella oleilytica]
MSKIDLNDVMFETMVIHAGQEPDKGTGALSTPIFQTSTFCFETVEEGAAKFSKEIPGYVYSRGGNPTNRALELKCAALEGGEDCVATASGMGAIGAVLLGLVKTGDHIVCGDTIYGGTSVVMRTNMPDLGIDVTFVDTTKPEEVEKAINEKTKVIYFETVTNPTLKLADIEEIAKIAKKHGVKLVVDNTFSPPPILSPLKLGADFVIHSVTKYINGHGDVIGGVIIGPKDDIAVIRGNYVTKICGTPPSPFNSYLVMRGMKTLPIRVREHCKNAMEMAEYLEKSEYVKTVYYPGLKSHPQHELAKKMLNGMYTGMIAFELKDDVKGLSAFEAGKKFLNNLKIASIAVSLGDPDTLIEHPASMTHASVPPESRLEVGITDGLIRLSVGLENVKDLIKDFEQSFAKL